MAVQLEEQEPPNAKTGDGDGEDGDDVSLEQHFFEILADQVGQMTTLQQLELSKALTRNKPWDGLSEGLKDHISSVCDELTDDGEDDPDDAEDNPDDGDATPQPDHDPRIRCIACAGVFQNQTDFDAHACDG